MATQVAPRKLGALGPCAILALVLGAPAAGAADPAPERTGIEFFEKKVRPVLVESCHACHSAGKKKRGGLLLDSRATLLKGGDTGPAVVPGDPEKSLLIQAIRYKDELRMPQRTKLPDAQIADLVAWVKMGAPWPDGGEVVKAGPDTFDFEKRRRHWSFQPLKKAPVPAVKNPAWPRGPLDRFVLARLEGAGLAPAGPADKRTLLRRVTYDLTGLPPTPREIADILADRSPDAYERVVERLLASPAYGERWGRHWLDLVRFAETSGHEFDFEILGATGYRDYVVRALNADVPYDRFLTEHVAGDLLPAPRRHPVERFNESVLGTGFWFLGESKHSPVDLRGDGADRRDNQIDVFSKTFVGLTVSCARCHDHKFDPIYTKDYYSLASYLQSSRMQLAFLDHPKVVGAPAARLRAAREEAQSLGAKLTQRALAERLSGLAAALASPGPVATAAGKVDLRQEEHPFHAWRSLTSPEVRSEAQFAARRKALLGQRQARAKRAEEAGKAYVPFDGFRENGYREWFVTGQAFGTGPSQVRDVELRPGAAFPVGRLVGAGVAHSGLTGGRLQGALRSKTFTIEKKHVLYQASGRGVRVNVIIDGFQKIQDPIYGGLTFVVNSGERPQWYVQNLSMWVGQRAYLELLDDGDGHVALEKVLFSDHGGPPPEQPNALLTRMLEDGAVTSADALARKYQSLLREVVADWQSRRLAGREDGAGRVALLNAILKCEIVAALPAGAGQVRAEERARLEKLLREAQSLEAALPRPRRGLAMADGTGVNERVHIRGNHKSLGEDAPRRLLVVLAGEKQALPRVGSGRLELARRMTEENWELPARVMVNRLWQHHFGAGIVRSPDDFGHQGERPTHPELLDYLAAEFVRQGWSLKAMHRMMVLSSTYRMASRADEETERADARNELLHRMPIRRLEAEAIRDTMLAVSGRLDRTMYGTGPRPYLTPFMIGRGRPGASGPLDGAGRRSIYLNVRRNFLNPMFLAFDYPIPFSTIGRRSVSNVPAQALTLLNNPFVTGQARLWAERVLEEPGLTDAQRVQRMYESAFGRAATAEELADALAFVAEQGKEHGRAGDVRAWADLGHVLFNVKELIFVN